jgi:putative ABC transport system ATP-binding protein
MNPVISLSHVNKSYTMGELKLPVLKDISLDIMPAEFVAITGASGSGKTTLMNILGCLDTLDSGHYQLTGEDISNSSSDTLARLRNQHIGFIFQSFNLLSRIDIVRNVELPLIYAAVPARKRKQMAIEALHQVGLGDRLDHLPSQISGGQQQRVAIARALITEPDVLLADEPTGSLDSVNGREIMQLFESLNQQGKTIVMVTHEAEIADYARRRITMQDGEIRC